MPPFPMDSGRNRGSSSALCSIARSTSGRLSTSPLRRSSRSMAARRVSGSTPLGLLSSTSLAGRYSAPAGTISRPKTRFPSLSSAKR